MLVCWGKRKNKKNLQKTRKKYGNLLRMSLSERRKRRARAVSQSFDRAQD